MPQNNYIEEKIRNEGRALDFQEKKLFYQKKI